MRYILLTYLCFTFFVSYGQTKTEQFSGDSIIKKRVDSIVQIKLDSITVKKKKDDARNKGLFDLLSEKGFVIRKGFSATTKDDQQPASAFWYKDFLTGFHYTSVDLAFKNTKLEIDGKKAANNAWSLIFSPKVEWHKNDDTTNNSKTTKNTLTGGVNIEYYYTIKNWTPFFTGSVDYKNDFIKKNETLNFAGYASAFSLNRFFPGSQIKFFNRDKFLLRYYLYTGFEYYKSVTKTTSSSSYWASKLSLEFNPIPQYMEMTFEYTYRAKIADHFYTLGDMYWLCIGANHYFDAKRRIGIGISYNKGNDPDNSFTKTKKIDLGVKFKI